MALDDQRRAAAADLTRIVAGHGDILHAAAPGPALTARIHAHLDEACRAGDACEHLDVRAPQPTFTALWAARRFACRRCLATLMQHPVVCVGCARPLDAAGAPIAASALQYDELLILFAECEGCQSASWF